MAESKATQRISGKGRRTLEDIFTLARSSLLSSQALHLWLLYRSFDSDGSGSFVVDEKVAADLGFKQTKSVGNYRRELKKKGCLQLVRRRGTLPPIYRAIMPNDRNYNSGLGGDDRNCGSGQAKPSEPVDRNCGSAVTGTVVPLSTEREYGEEENRLRSPSEKRRKVKASDPSSVKQPTAISRAAEIWKDLLGGPPSHGRIGKALKPLLAEHGEEEVLAVWEGYLKSQPAQYVNPQDFAAKFGTWRDGAPVKRGSAFHDDLRGGPRFKADSPLSDIAEAS